MKIWLIALLAATFIFRGSDASAYYYKQYTRAGGLISNTVYHSLLDSKGYMWFFTDKGVAKFDGATFKNFTVFDGLSDEDGYFGYEDKLGRLWIFTSNGHPCFIKNDTVYNAGNSALLKKLPKISFMISILEQGGSLYIGYNKGQIIKIRGNDVKYIVRESKWPIFSLAAKSDTVVVYAGNGVYNIYRDNVIAAKGWTYSYNYHDSWGIIRSTDQGVEIYQNHRPIFQRNDSDIVYSKTLHMFYDGIKNLLCCTRTGLYIIDTKTGHKDKLFNHIQISSAMQDMYGNYWITTLDHGVYFLHKDLDKIRLLDKVTNYHPIILNNGQFFFLKDNSIYNLVNHDSLVLNELPISFSAFNSPVFINKNYFIYSSHFKLVLFNFHTHKTFEAIESRHIYEIDSNTLLGVGGAIYLISLSDNKIECRMVNDPHIHHKNAYNDQKVFFDRDNQINCYDLATKKLSRFDVLNDYQSIHQIYYIKDQLIVITNDRKIILYDANDNNKKYTVDNYPFICYDISSIETIDKQTKYLLNTNNGYYITTDLKKLKTNSRKLDYLAKPSDLFGVYALGHYLICDINGSFYVINDSLTDKTQQVPVFYVGNVLINGKSAGPGYTVSGNSRENHITVELNCLKFNNTNNSYQYKIIRANDTSNWYNAASDKLDILLEKDGTYSIAIRAITENNLASALRYVRFTITPPFYRTLTFSIIVGLLIALLIYMAVAIYNRYRKKAYESELDYLQLEHKAVNSLLNPHFIFNAINNIQNLININSKETANNYLVILSKLIRQNIENLQFSFIPVAREINLVKNYIHLQNLRFGNKLVLEINKISGEIEQINIPPLLIHTFVENSVIHGYKNAAEHFTISIELSLSVDDYLIISIRDNGAGITENKKEALLADKTSLGIDFIRKRLSRISAFYNVEFTLDIHNTTVPGKTGTEVIIILYAKFGDELAKKKQGNF